MSLLRRRRAPAVPDHLDAPKLRAIDFAFEQLGARTFADLGGVWAVDGGYSAYAAGNHAATRGVLVDDAFTPRVHAHAEALGTLELVQGNFGRPEVAERVGEVDVVLLFDVLLHQVAPDWDEILDLYAPQTRSFAIVQPQWNEAGVVRLLDLGEKEYLAAVPARGEPVYEGLYGRLDEINPDRGRPWRDVHDIWQWGVSDQALAAKLEALGFRVAHREIGGAWRGLDRFHLGAFVATRDG